MTTMIGYLRVSTEEQSDNGLELEAQRDTIRRYADAHGWDVVWYEDAGLSAKSLDRLSRSVVDFAGVLERARARQWSLVAIDLGVDTSTATGEMVANVMMAVAQWERRVIGERTSAAMQAAKRQGKHMGRHSALPEETGARLLELRRTCTLAATADALNAEGYTTATGTAWDEHKVCKTQHRLARDEAARMLRKAVAA